MRRNTLAATLLLFISLPALALKSDPDAPINIESASQSVDMQTNKITFTGNVIIKQGSIDIRADRVEVHRPNDQQGTEIIKAFGKPVQFSQQQESGKPVKGHSRELTYALKTKKLTLTGDAFLEQLDSNVQSHQIVYLPQEQRMDASGGRVMTVIEPAQLQNKTPPPATPLAKVSTPTAVKASEKSAKANTSTSTATTTATTRNNVPTQPVTKENDQAPKHTLRLYTDNVPLSKNDVPLFSKKSENYN